MAILTPLIENMKKLRTKLYFIIPETNKKSCEKIPLHSLIEIQQSLVSCGF